MEVNERFVISDDHSSLPINVGVPSFATSCNCKQLIVINIVVFLTTCGGLAQEDNGFVNRYMLLCKYTTYSSVRCTNFNLEWFVKSGQDKNRMNA